LATPWSRAGDVDAVAHQITVRFLDYVAEVNADAKLDPAIRRHAGVAFDHRGLDLDGAAHRLDDAAELDNAAVARAFDDAAMMHGDDRVDQVAAKRPETGEDPIFIGPGELAVTDNVGQKNRRELSGLAHCAVLRSRTLTRKEHQIIRVQAAVAASRRRGTAAPATSC
jgi:hypothetical protein